MNRPVLAALATLVLAAPAAAADNSRYALANGCYALTSNGQPVGPGPFFMKPTALGSYMLYTKDRRFLAKTGAKTVGTADAPGPAAEWVVDGTTGAFTLSTGGSKLTATGPLLTLGAGTTFGFTNADGCTAFPE